MDKIEKTVDKLASFYTKDCSLPECTYMFGMKSTGKSQVIEKFLNQSEWINFVIVSASDCYTSKILFDSIVNKFNNHELSSLNGYENFAKIDNIEEFLTELANLDHKKSYLIIVENAEKLRDMDANILPVLMRLQEFTNLNISCLLVSHLPIEKFGVHNIPKIYVPNYSKNEIIDILAGKYSTIYDQIIKSIDEEETEKLKLAEHLDENFYRQFLNIFMNVSFKTCRDLNELEPIAIKCYLSYYTPVLSGEIKHTDVTNLWRNLSHILRASINSSHMRIQNISMKDLGKENETNLDPSQENQKNLRTFAQNLELPFYAKYLLIASFLASHNDAKFDKRLFMKHHGKERKRAHKATVSKIVIFCQFSLIEFH